MSITGAIRSLFTIGQQACDILTMLLTDPDPFRLGAPPDGEQPMPGRPVELADICDRLDTLNVLVEDIRNLLQHYSEQQDKFFGFK